MNTAVSGLLPIPFRGGMVYAQIAETALSDSDAQLLRREFQSQMSLLDPFLQTHQAQVYVPLSGPEDGYHLSVSGRCSLEHFDAFFRKTPNGLTVVDGRPWGFFRIRLIAIADDLSFERLAEVEVLAAENPGESGFELFWGEPERAPMHIRLYDRRPVEGAQQVEGLVTQWAKRIRQTQILNARERAALMAEGIFK